MLAIQHSEKVRKDGRRTIPKIRLENLEHLGYGMNSFQKNMKWKFGNMEPTSFKHIKGFLNLWKFEIFNLIWERASVEQSCWLMFGNVGVIELKPYFSGVNTSGVNDRLNKRKPTWWNLNKIFKTLKPFQGS